MFFDIKSTEVCFFESRPEYDSHSGMFIYYFIFFRKDKIMIYIREIIISFFNDLLSL